MNLHPKFTNPRKEVDIQNPNPSIQKINCRSSISVRMYSIWASNNYLQSVSWTSCSNWKCELWRNRGWIAWHVRGGICQFEIGHEHDDMLNLSNWKMHNPNKLCDISLDFLFFGNVAGNYQQYLVNDAQPWHDVLVFLSKYVPNIWSLEFCFFYVSGNCFCMYVDGFWMVSLNGY